MNPEFLVQSCTVLLDIRLMLGDALLHHVSILLFIESSIVSLIRTRKVARAYARACCLILFEILLL